jgi:hypothetical protein
MGVDVYVDMTSPQMKVTIEDGPGERLEVQIGDTHYSVTGETSTVHLWFKNPQAVINLAREMLEQGQLFLGQQPVRDAEKAGRVSGGVTDVG